MQGAYASQELVQVWGLLIPLGFHQPSKGIAKFFSPSIHSLLPLQSRCCYSQQSLDTRGKCILGGKRKVTLNVTDPAMESPSHLVFDSELPPLLHPWWANSLTPGRPSLMKSLSFLSLLETVHFFVLFFFKTLALDVCNSLFIRLSLMITELLERRNRFYSCKFLSPGATQNA